MKIGRLIITTGGVITALLAIPSFAQSGEDEDAMFADSSSVVDSAKMINTQAASDAFIEKKTVGWSGEVNTYLNPSVSRTWFDSTTLSGVSFPSRIVGNGIVDVRLIGGVKAYADLQASYVPSQSYDMALSSGLTDADSGMVFDVPEFSIDVNYHKLVYLRAGKQVLQWGRCYLWNPTDFVNVEQKTFLQRMGHREGSYGLKMHIPYQTLFNFYSFVDVGQVGTVDSLAASAKAEVLIGRTEVALSLHGKRREKPIFGIDFSSQLFNVQIVGEMSLRNGKDMKTLDMNDTMIDDMGDKWIPRASVNFMKFFPLAGVADRMTVSTEFYYNAAGYEPNLFDGGVIDFARILGTVVRKSGVDPQTALSLYEPNSYSKFYGMLSTTISRFILSDMAFSCSAVGNFNQRCAILTSGVSYQSLNDFVFSANVNGYVGDKNTEYTFTNSGLGMVVRMGIVF